MAGSKLYQHDKYSKKCKSIDIIKTTQITAGVITDDYRGLWESIKVKILTSDGALSTKTVS